MKQVNKVFISLLFVLLINKAWSQTTTITLTPAADAAVGFHDNYNSANNNGAAANYFGAFYQPGAVGGSNGGRGLINFNLSSIPFGSQVVSAKLSLYGTGKINNNGAATAAGNIGDNTSYLERITTPWNESFITWNTQPAVTDQNRVTLEQSTSANQDYLDIDVTQLVNDMINNPANSFGFRLSLADESITKGLFFASTEFGDPNKIPTLVITIKSESCPNGITYDVSYDDATAGFHDGYGSANSNGRAADYFGPFYQPGASGGNNGGRSFMQPDVSNIPPGIKISSAKLSLYGRGAISGAGAAASVGNTGNNSCYIELISAPWNISTFTWNTQPAVTTVDRVLVPGTSALIQDYLDIDITRLMQHIIDDPSKNYGFRMRLVNESGTAALFFCSKDFADANKHPKLVVTVCENAGCLAYFTANSINDSVHIQNYSSSNIAKATWDFGDGTTDTTLHASEAFAHGYNQSGDYTITLTTADSSGTCLDTFIRTIHACATTAAFTTNTTDNEVTCTSTSANAGLIHWDFGDGSADLSNAAEVTHRYAMPGNYRVTLRVWEDSLYQCFDSLSTVIAITLTNPDTLSGIVYNDINNDGVQNSLETGIEGMTVYLADKTTVYASAETDATGKYTFIAGTGTWDIANEHPEHWSQTFPVNPFFYTVTNKSEGKNTPGFDFGLHNNQVTISGNVYYDNNKNGKRDQDESGVENEPVRIGSKKYFTDARGNYTVVVNPGTYKITYTTKQYGYTITEPASGVIDIVDADSGRIYSGNDFGIWANPDLKDLTVSISEYQPALRGFDSWYYITYSNKGIKATGAVITLQLDSNLQYNSADPNAATVDNVNHTATWNISNIAPGKSGHISVYVDVPQSVALGSELVNIVNIEPSTGDFSPENNADTLYQLVVGSFDPNDKNVIPSGPIRPATKLDYTIRFQNTGTWAAVNVIVIDTISEALDLNTFSMISTSHPYNLQIGDDRVVKWTFPNLMLPDSGSNQEGSNGFIKFSIYPVQFIAQGTPINNFADIYFDFNEPVRTNTTENNIDLTLDVTKPYVNNIEILTYPNPMKDYSNIVVNGAENKKYELRLYNVLGERISTLAGVTGQTVTLQRNNLNAGLYMYEIVIDGIAQKQGKLIVE